MSEVVEPKRPRGRQKGWRKPEEERLSVRHVFHSNQAQADKLELLGGKDWILGMIDAAELPVMMVK